jgi:hypothetical protein
MVQRLLGISGGSTDLTHALRSWEILVRDGRSATGMALLSIAESRRSTGDPASSALQRQNTMFLPCSHWCSPPLSTKDSDGALDLDAALRGPPQLSSNR